MLSIVNYGSSDSENEISEDEEGFTSQVLEKVEETDNNFIRKTSIQLPEPSIQKSFITEEDDEFLHKKAIPSVAPPKAKIKIMIPRLSDFKDEEEDNQQQKLNLKMQPANKKSGLLSMLPKPSHSFAPAPKPVYSTSASNAQSAQTIAQKSILEPPATDVPKKVGLIPYALMSHKPKAQESKKSVKKKQEGSDDESDDEHVGSFFTFASKDDELPKVNEDETKALIAKEAARMEQRKRQNEETEVDHSEGSNDMYEEQRQQNIDEEAMKALMGGNKAKRSKIDNIQIIDLSAAEVMPNREEWIRKTLAGETSYQPTGNIIDKGPSALAKRKHQISYLSMRAENNEAELEAMWAASRVTQREGKSKYGF